MRANSQRKLGFTIVELLVVIVVIGILAAITVVAYSGIQQRARDAKRASDLSAVASALEAQYAIKGEYPLTVGVGAPTSCLSGPGWGCWGSSGGASFLDSEFMKRTPEDPSFYDNNACGYPNNDLTRAYWYQVSADKQGYILGTYMEASPTTNPNYDNGSVNRACGNFINWAIKRNWPN